MASSAEGKRASWPFWLLAGLLVVAWWQLYRMDVEMRAMAAMAMAMPESPSWSGPDWLAVVLAWSLMMTAMMVPASWPLLQLLRRYGNRTLLPLLLGYVTVWSVFSAVAAGLQWALTQTPWYDAVHQRLASGLGAVVLLAAAGYQLSALKHACLSRCQSPVTLLFGHWRAGFTGTLRLGLYHGTFCVGCCWLLMLVLFALGAMSVYWAALLALATTAERLLPPPWPGRLLAAALALGSLLLLWLG